jgi:hypothetical protein
MYSIKVGKQGNLVNNMVNSGVVGVKLNPASRGLRLPLAPTGSHPPSIFRPCAPDGASVTETPFLFFQATARGFCDAQ